MNKKIGVFYKLFLPKIGKKAKEKREAALPFLKKRERKYTDWKFV